MIVSAAAIAMFKSASRKFRDGLADSYWGRRVADHGDDPYDATILTIALSRDPDVVDLVEREAQARVNQWLSTYWSYPVSVDTSVRRRLLSVAPVS